MTRRSSIVLAAIAVLIAGGALLLLPAFRGAVSEAVSPNSSPSQMPANDHSQPAASPTPPTPAGTERGDLMLDPRRQQLIGVRTATVQRVMTAPQIRMVGTVAFDETRQADVNTKIDGWIRDLYVDYTGRPVRQGEPLFTLYSPDLLATQNELLLARRGHAQTEHSQLEGAREYSERLVEAARQRLALWDVSPQEIEGLEKTAVASGLVTFRSPAPGIVVEKTAVKGMRVMAGQSLYKVADLSVIWVEANVYEQDLRLVRVGQTAAVTLDAYPGDRFVGRAIYVHPTVDAQTRTGRVRFQFANRGGRLRPGMYANVELSAPSASGLTVPGNAVLDSGTEQIVFVSEGEGRFTPRRVKVGHRVGDDLEIIDGVKEGEQVATSAAFFLDSESQLRAATQSYETPQGPNATSSTPRERIDITFRPQPDPPKTGENMLEVSVKDASGKPIADADVSVTFFMPAMPTMNMPAMRNQAKLAPAGGGVYRGPGQVMMAGRWDVTVDVSRDGTRLGSQRFAVVAR